MDEVLEQLRQLSIVNRRLSFIETNNDSQLDRSQVTVAKLVSSIEEKNVLHDYQGAPGDCDGILNKRKVGPLVPPKPLKKSSNIPEIPQSSLTKQTYEHLYGQRLQNVDFTNYDGEMSKLPLHLHLRKQNYASRDVDAVSNWQASLGPTTSRKVTLDNPAILQQQLEVLEHHKKQLEKCKKLNHNSSSNSKLTAMYLNVPKLSISSLLSGVSLNTHRFVDNANVSYTNNIHAKATLSSAVDGNLKSNIYGNIISAPAAALNNINSNVAYEKYEQQEQTCAEEQYLSPSKIPLSTAVPPLDEDSSEDSTYNGCMIREEDLPTTASSVCYSYIEMRKAIEISKTNNGRERYRSLSF